MAPHCEWPMHDHQARAEALRRELDAADLRRRDDVAGDANHEQIAEALIEHELGRHARVRAAEDDRERRLAGHELGTPRLVRVLERAHLVGDEPRVAFAQAAEAFEPGDHARADSRRPHTARLAATPPRIRFSA